MLPPTDKRWIVAAPLSPDDDLALSAYSPLLRQLLVNRGIHTDQEARIYLEARPPDGCDHRDMLGIAEGVDRIGHAIRNREPIAIYGDYDVDGVTATALLTQMLGMLDAEVRGYIPNRFEEGYGLNIDALTALREDGIKLVITVDCGIRSPEEAAHARQIRLDLIITDHHMPAEEIPSALAVINPKQPGDHYPDKNLAGVGLAYKLACGVLDDASGRQPPLDEYLDLVALGTIADLAPLTGENRSLVRQGLEGIRRPHRQGVMSLIGAAAIRNPRMVSCDDIGYMLGPRLNAAGRLSSAMAALNLLLTHDVQQAGRLAQELENENRRRQEITKELQAHAEQSVLQAGQDNLLLFAADESYNPGIIGLAASRLMEQYYLPAIVATRSEEYTRGSCRSIPEFHITRALDECADLLIKHGGHSVAAGFTVRTADLPELVSRLKEITHRELAGKDLRPTLYADAEVPLSGLRPELLKDLERLQPTGMENPKAVFISRGVRVSRKQLIGKDHSHLKLYVTDGRITFDAIAFRMGHLYDQIPDRIDLMYTFELNEFNGRESLQLKVRDMKIN